MKRKKSKDLYRSFAAKIFETPMKEVSPLQRQVAKALLFGEMYSQNEAMTEFFKSWAKIPSPKRKENRK